MTCRLLFTIAAALLAFNSAAQTERYPLKPLRIVTAEVGGVEANFWRITLATIFLTIWAFTFGHGFDGAPGWFMLSGLFGN